MESINFRLGPYATSGKLEEMEIPDTLGLKKHQNITKESVMLLEEVLEPFQERGDHYVNAKIIIQKGWDGVKF